MAVKPAELENPERDLSLETREQGKGADSGRARAELQALQERLAAAKSMKPKDTQPHCGDCFRRGWAAALRMVEGRE